MWSRVVEIMLACWLLVSPFVFQHSSQETMLWVSDFACAVAVATLAMLSYWPPTRHAHLVTVLVALWLILFGRFAVAAPIPPGYQNEMVVGLLLLMFAIVPNHAARMPLAWSRQQQQTTAAN